MLEQTCSFLEQTSLRQPFLRWMPDEDGTVIVKAVRRKHARDHLYWHGPGILGIYYERDTPVQARNAMDWYLRRSGPAFRIIEGDQDGLVLFLAWCEDDIPGIFKKSRSRQAQGRKVRMGADIPIHA